MSLLVAERGVQLPSFEIVPPFFGEDGEQAVALAAGYGLTPDPWQAATIDAWLGRRPDGQWASPRCGLVVPRQNGKNAVLEIRELFGVIALGERVLHTAHEVKTARKAFLRLCSFFENEREFPELAALVREVRKTNGQEAIVLRNGGSVEFIARSKSSGRGFSVDVLVLDEVQEASEEALAALLPTISASPNPQVIFTGTPPGPKADGEVFTRVRQSAHDETDRGLCWREWACAEGVDPFDVAEIARANPSLGIRLLIETVEGERSMMDPAEFARERLGVWDSSANTGGLDMARWAELHIPPEDKRPSPVAFAVAVSRDRQWAHIGLAGLRSDGKRHLQVIRSGRGTDWVVGALLELSAEHKPVGIAVNPASPAGSLIADMQSAGIEPVLVTGRDEGQAVGMFLDGFAQGSICHQGETVLGMAVEHATLRDAGQAQAWDYRGDVDVAPLQAVTAALFALMAKKPEKKRSGLVVGMR